MTTKIDLDSPSHECPACGGLGQIEGPPWRFKDAPGGAYLIDPTGQTWGGIGRIPDGPWHWFHASDGLPNYVDSKEEAKRELVASIERGEFERQPTHPKH